FGRAQSFFDFFSQAAVGYLGFVPVADTGDGGWDLMGYTAQFGNGFSASISAEQRRTTQIIGQGINCGNGIVVVNGVAVACQGGFTGGGFFDAGLAANPNAGSINGGPGAAATNTGFGYGGWQAPDIVGNLRVDQAWGSATIAAAAHEVNAAYYLGNQNN